MIKTFYRVPVDSGPQALPIGEPLPGTTLEVRDSEGRVCKPGESGELVIRTPHATFGYLAEPAAPGVLAIDPATRIEGEYRTRDTASIGTDGNIRIGGRLDGVLKLRGVRFHPSEIEAAALQIDAVSACHVELIRKDNREHLVLFWVPADAGGTGTEERLRSALAASLPPALQPGQFQSVPAVPTLLNGKADRSALLAAWNPPGTMAHSALSAEPETETQGTLAAIWRELLSVERVGLDDDFFELGGHSLLATIMISRARAAFRCDLSLRDVLATPSVRGIAACLDERRAADQPGASAGNGLSQHLVSLARAPGLDKVPTVFAVHALGGDALAFRSLAEKLGGRISISAFQARLELLDTRDVRQIAAGYAYEMTEAQPQGPYRLLAWSAGGVIAWEMAQQLGLDGEEVELFLIDSYAAGSSALGHLAAPDHELADSFRRDLLRSGVPAATVDSWQPSGTRDGGLSEAHPLQERFAVYASASRAVSTYAVRAAAVIPRTVLMRGTDEVRPQDSDRSLGWSDLTGGAVEVVDVPGNHYGLLTDQIAEVIARELLARIRPEA